MTGKKKCVNVWSVHVRDVRGTERDKEAVCNVNLSKGERGNIIHPQHTFPATACTSNRL